MQEKYSQEELCLNLTTAVGNFIRAGEGGGNDRARNSGSSPQGYENLCSKQDFSRKSCRIEVTVFSVCFLPHFLRINILSEPLSTNLDLFVELTIANFWRVALQAGSCKGN